MASSTTGQCVDIPSELPGARIASESATNYPLVGAADPLDLYAADRQHRFEWEFATVADRTVCFKTLAGVHYAGALEGGIDSSHVSFRIAAISKPIPPSKAPKATNTIWAI